MSCSDECLLYPKIITVFKESKPDHTIEFTDNDGHLYRCVRTRQSVLANLVLDIKIVPKLNNLEKFQFPESQL